MTRITSRHIIVMTRLPRIARNKTRLIPALGPAGATRLHDRLARHAIGRASAFARETGAKLTIRLEGGTPVQGREWLGECDCREQSPGDLGRRMRDACDTAFSEGAEQVVVIGTDCPEIDPETFAKAFDALEKFDLVFGPALDGGYYLVGMAAPTGRIFQDIPWGGENVLETSLAVAKSSDLAASLLPSLPDVDLAEDLPAGLAALDRGETVSIIIPTLNEGSGIAALLNRLALSRPYEIIVSDGGSIDATKLLAEKHGTRVIDAPKGRAAQMNAGAAIATGEYLLILHADTIPPENFPALLRDTLNRPDTAAGAFRFRLDDDLPSAPLIEKLVHLRCRFFRTPYGDQGLFLRRSLFEKSGGFTVRNSMEDLEITRRLRNFGKVTTIAAEAITSSRRWRDGGLVSTFLRHQLMLTAYHIRLPDKLISSLRK